MTSEITPTESEFNKLGHEVYEHEPDVVQKFLYVLNRPTPTFTHFQIIWPLQQKFCVFNNISFKDFRSATKINNAIGFRRDFISVIIYLFNPEVLTGYSDVVTTGLAEEIRKALNVDRTWVSQEVGNIKRLFKKKNYEQPAILEQREKIIGIAQAISEGLVEIEPEQAEIVSLFKDQTG